MKKMFFILSVFLAVFLLTGVSAISLDIKPNYERQETMIMKISGDIREPITNNNIVLKRGHVDVPLEYDVKKLGNDYYVWAIAPLNANNYTLWINDVTTRVGGVVKTVDFDYNFTVSEILTNYYIRPAIIFSDKDFDINAYNNEDLTKEVNIDFPESRTVALQPGENKITFSISEVKGTQLINFSFGKYDVRAYIIGKAENATNITEGNVSGTISNFSNVSEISIYFIPQKIKREIFAGESEVYPITIVNNGVRADNISLKYNKDIFSITPNIPSSLDSRESFSFNLSMRASKNLNEIIELITEENNFNLTIELVISNLSISSANATVKKGLYYCDELAGKVCKIEEKCSVNVITSLDGSCCKGDCVTQEAESSWGSIIGYIVAAFVVIGIIFIYFRYRSVKAEKNPLTRKVTEAERKLP